MAEADVRPARRGLGDVPGVRGVDHVRALRGVGHPQRDPQVRVGPDLRGHHAGWTLGGQQQVDAQRAAPLRDVDQAGDEVGQVPGHRRELVDHDHQPGQRRGPAAGPRGPLLQVEKVLDVLGAGPGQDVLAPGQLGGQRGQGPLDQVRVQVGDHAHGVRQADAVLERAAALVVDEHERHRVRPVGHRQCGHDRLQQLGLARAGGAGDQAVRAVPADVDAERAVEGLAHDRQRGPAHGPPAGGDHCGVRRFEAEHVQQAARLRQPGAVLVGADVPDRGDAAGQPGAPVRDRRVRPHPGQRGRAHLLHP
jgi:hypothetical protein